MRRIFLLIPYCHIETICFSLKFLETECDGIEMQKVTSDCIREWVALLSEGGMSARSICRKISSLRLFTVILWCNRIFKKAL